MCEYVSNFSLNRQRFPALAHHFRRQNLPLHFENRSEIFGFVYGIRDGKRIRRKN